MVMTGVVLLWVAAAAMVFGVWQYMEHRKDVQNARNAFLRTEIAALEDEIKEIQDLRERREKLVARMDIIQGLQQTRTEIVRILDELVRILPEGVYLTRLNKVDAVLSLEGRAQSNGRVSSFMRALEDSPWFHGPSLDVINVVSDQGERVSAFSLRVARAGAAPKSDEQSN